MASNSEPGNLPSPPPGPPYAPKHTTLGGVPTIIPDVPITFVYLLIYMALTIVHLKILKLNKSQGHKFAFSGATTAFCAIRVATMIFRIIWAFKSRNINFAIIAHVFVYAGIIILYGSNWFFAQRIIRAQHPKFGWSGLYRWIHRGGLVGLVCCLLVLIVVNIQQFFTLDHRAHEIERTLVLAVLTYFALFSFAPLVLVALSVTLSHSKAEKFGKGKIRNKAVIVIAAAAMVSLGALFRCIIAWIRPIPLLLPNGKPNPPPWYFSRACFYIFNFLTEIFVIVLWALVRFDQRFYIPDGSKGPGDYSRPAARNRAIENAERFIKQYNAGNVSPYPTELITNKPALSRSDTDRQALLSGPRIPSPEALRRYTPSPFEESDAVAESVQQPGSAHTVDSTTKPWKDRRAPSPNDINSFKSPTDVLDRSGPVEENKVDKTPPLPPIPKDLPPWPLRDSVDYLRDSVDVQAPRQAIVAVSSAKIKKREQLEKVNGTRTGHLYDQGFEQYEMKEHPNCADSRVTDSSFDTFIGSHNGSRSPTAYHTLNSHTVRKENGGGNARGTELLGITKELQLARGSSETPPQIRDSVFKAYAFSNEMEAELWRTRF